MFFLVVVMTALQQSPTAYFGAACYGRVHLFIFSFNGVNKCREIKCVNPFPAHPAASIPLLPQTRSLPQPPTEVLYTLNLIKFHQ